MGHDGGFISLPLTELQLVQRNQNIDLTLASDDAKLRRWIDGLAQQLDRPMQDASLTRDSGTAAISPGQNGRSLDREALRQTLTQAVSAGTSLAIAAPVTIVPQARTAGALEPAVVQVRQALSSTPLRLQFEGKSWTIPAESITPLVSWSLPPAPSSNVSFSVDQTRLRPQIEGMAKDVAQTPKDATLSWGASGLTIASPSRDGRQLDVETTIRNITAAIAKRETPVTLAVIVTPAKISSQNPAALGIKELVAEGVSNYSYSPYARVVNIKNMVRKLNGTVLAPGEEFSFNAVMGDITPSEGWAEGLVIEGDRTVPGLGGGICQVSTTAFRAAFWAGVPITERHDHAYPVPYYTQGGYPEGFDATVWSPDLDFKFVNDTGSFMLIQATMDTARQDVHVSLFGTKPARTVKLEGPQIWNVTPARAPKHILDPKKPKGYVEQTDVPHQGMSVLIRRIVTAGSDTHVDQFRSDYSPWGAVFVEGPKDDAAPASDGVDPKDS
jgi:vancomycin resistance protein YoaR